MCRLSDCESLILAISVLCLLCSQFLCTLFLGYNSGYQFNVIKLKDAINLRANNFLINSVLCEK